MKQALLKKPGAKPLPLNRVLVSNFIDRMTTINLRVSDVQKEFNPRINPRTLWAKFRMEIGWRSSEEKEVERIISKHEKIIRKSI